MTPRAAIALLILYLTAVVGALTMAGGLAPSTTWAVDCGDHDPRICD